VSFSGALTRGDAQRLTSCHGRLVSYSCHFFTLRAEPPITLTACGGLSVGAWLLHYVTRQPGSVVEETRRRCRSTARRRPQFSSKGRTAFSHFVADRTAVLLPHNFKSRALAARFIASLACEFSPNHAS
jgi:hypothetical protein